jgi:hypothetical protein
MRLIIFIVGTLGLSSWSARLAPAEDGWQVLGTVKFTPKFIKEYNESFLFPAFDAAMKAREGKEFVLKGHYLPMEFDDAKMIVVSKFPYAACFFCGGAGPESVAEVHFTEKPKRFKTDQIITIKGILKLNDKDVNHMNFILTQAHLVP